MTDYFTSFKVFMATINHDGFPEITYTTKEVREVVKIEVTRAVIITALISIVVSFFLFMFVNFLIHRRTHNVFFGDYNVVTVRHNRIVQLPHPEKDGYIFCGWYRDENFKTKFLPTETVIQDLYLYPKWEKDTESKNP